MTSNFSIYISKFAIRTRHVYTTETASQKACGDLQLQVANLKKNPQNSSILKSEVCPRFQNIGIYFKNLPAIDFMLLVIFAIQY